MCNRIGSSLFELTSNVLCVRVPVRPSVRPFVRPQHWHVCTRMWRQGWWKKKKRRETGTGSIAILFTIVRWLVRSPCRIFFVLANELILFIYFLLFLSLSHSAYLCYSISVPVCWEGKCYYVTFSSWKENDDCPQPLRRWQHNIVYTRCNVFNRYLSDDGSNKDFSVARWPHVHNIPDNYRVTVFVCSAETKMAIGMRTFR